MYLLTVNLKSLREYYSSVVITISTSSKKVSAEFSCTFTGKGDGRDGDGKSVKVTHQSSAKTRYICGVNEEKGPRYIFAVT